MERTISNKHDAKISTHAIMSVINAKLIHARLVKLQHELDTMDELNCWNAKLIKANYNELCSMLHKHLMGWS